jgi:hypothetical protein
VLGVRSAAQAEANFGSGAGAPLAQADLDRIGQLQRDLGLRHKPRPLWRRVLDRLRR